jgi:hypothetical protein
MAAEKKSFAYKQRQLMIDYQNTFNSETGKRVLYDLMRVHHVVSLSHVKNNPDMTTFHEGERNVVLRIMSNLNFKIADLDEAIKQGELEDESY